jgi:hypothetical protein
MVMLLFCWVVFVLVDYVVFLGYFGALFFKYLLDPAGNGLIRRRPISGYVSAALAPPLVERIQFEEELI